MNQRVIHILDDKEFSRSNFTSYFADIALSFLNLIGVNFKTRNCKNMTLKIQFICLRLTFTISFYHTIYW